jgi:hypothetical protein
MTILTLQKYRGRNPKGYFQDLPLEARQRAHQWLHKFVSRWGYDLPNWRFAILVGQARRLALNPPTSSWGRSMHAKRGGLAVQRKYRIQGKHPTQRATEVRLFKQKKKKAEDRFRSQYGYYLQKCEEQTSEMRIKHLELF